MRNVGPAGVAARVVAAVTVVSAVVSCTVTADVAERTPRPTPAAFAATRPVRDLVLPLMQLSPGYTVTHAGTLTAAELAETTAVSELRQERKAFLARDGFVSAGYRGFDYANGGATPRRAWVVVVIFGTEAGARQAVDDFGDDGERHGFHKAAIGNGVGERARAVGVDTAIELNGKKIEVSFGALWFSFRNVVVQATVQDDVGSPNVVLGCIELAKEQLRFLRDQLQSAP